MASVSEDDVSRDKSNHSSSGSHETAASDCGSSSSTRQHHPRLASIASRIESPTSKSKCSAEVGDRRSRRSESRRVAMLSEKDGGNRIKEEVEAKAEAEEEKIFPDSTTADCRSVTSTAVKPAAASRTKPRTKLKAPASSDLGKLVHLDEDFLIWKDGVGYLPGSCMKFRRNSYGLLELVAEPDESNTTPGGVNGEMEDAACYEFGNEPVSKESVEENGEMERSSAVSNLAAAASTSVGEGMATGGSTSLYGRRRKQRIIDGEVVSLMGRRDRLVLSSSDLDKSRWQTVFNWPTYLSDVSGVAAPPELFRHVPAELLNSQPSSCPSKPVLRVGQRLEGVDPNRESLFCVLSVAELCGQRVRLHFDGFAEQYDFWVNSDCPFIFPAGWCQHNGRLLQLPKGVTAEEFSWDTYLSDCGAAAAPRSLFVTPWDCVSGTAIY